MQRKLEIQLIHISLTSVTNLYILSSGPLSGAGINPARCFGAAVAFSDWSSMWVYVVGPFAGAAVAGILHRLVLASRSIPSPKLSVLKMIRPSYVDTEELSEDRQSTNNWETTF